MLVDQDLTNIQAALLALGTSPSRLREADMSRREVR